MPLLVATARTPRHRAQREPARHKANIRQGLQRGRQRPPLNPTPAAALPAYRQPRQLPGRQAAAQARQLARFRRPRDAAVSRRPAPPDSAARRSEVSALRWADVEDAGGETSDVRYPKNGAARAAIAPAPAGRVDPSLRAAG